MSMLGALAKLAAQVRDQVNAERAEGLAWLRTILGDHVEINEHGAIELIWRREESAS